MTIEERFKLYIDSDGLFCRELPFHENCLFILMFTGYCASSIIIATVLAITTPIWGFLIGCGVVEKTKIKNFKNFYKKDFTFDSNCSTMILYQKCSTASTP